MTMASNQHSEATKQIADTDPTLQHINDNNTSQIATQGFYANHFSSPMNEAHEIINDIPPSTEPLPQQYPLEFHLYAPASANAVAVVHSQASNSLIHVFIPAAHPPLSHTEFHIVPEHGNIANPGIQYHREVPAEGQIFLYLSPGLRVVPVDLQNPGGELGQHVIEGGEATFYASDELMSDLVEQMHGDMGVQEQGTHGQLHHMPHAYHLPYMDTHEQGHDNITDDVLLGTLFSDTEDVMAAWRPQLPNPRPHSLHDVLRFVQTLPKIEIDELDDESKECSICRGPYGEPVSFDGGKVEKPVQLPCGHVFGKGCLKVLLSPKCEGEESGWGERLCPLCRRVIEF